MKRFKLTVLKNAAANVLRGVATAVVALALPHFLTRSLTPDRFGAWSLMVQVAACATYLDFGLQTAVACRVAQIVEGGENARLNRLLTTALIMLAGAATLAMIAIGILLWQLPAIFHGIPSSLLHEFRLAAILLAACTCALLPLSAYTGVLTGLHRNEFPALAIGGSRLVGAAAAIGAGYLSHSLIVLAACVGVASLLGGLVQVAAAHRLLLVLRLSAFDWTMAAELYRYCLGLTVWSLGVFLVNGIDLTIVGHFQFQSVGYYSVATTVITCFIGFGFAVLNALMTPIAVLYGRGEFERIRSTVFLATRWTIASNAVIVACIFAFGKPLLTLWVGSAYADPALSILKILVVAQAIRFVGAAFCIMLVATDQHRHGIEGAIMEGVVSLVASLIGAVWLGPIGVALGTLAGTSSGLLWILLRTMPRAQAVPIARMEFLIQGILRPSLCCLPLALAEIPLPSEFRLIQVWLLPLAILATAYLTLRIGRLLPMPLQAQR